MPRYEFSKGGSNKFWEISLSNKSFTTTYGKVGTTGQTSSKSFASAADAKKAYQKLIDAKTKKGYALSKKTAAKTAAKKTPAKKATPAKKTAANKIPAKKATATKKKSAAADPSEAGASASGQAGARYFEFVDGKSSKFWEVLIEGKTVNTRYGKIGAKGQSKGKASASVSAAKTARDKLVAEKTKKGYVEKGTVAQAESIFCSAANPKLEACIVAHPEDLDGYAVLSDWLLEQGDPRGELMSLHLNNKDKPAKRLIEKQSAYFLGALAEHQLVHDEGWNNASSSLRTPAQEKAWQKTQRQAFLWRLGYIDRVRLSHDSYSDEEFDGKTVDILGALLSHPSGRFVSEFSFQSNGDPNDDNLQDLIDLLGKKAPETTRKITFGDNVDQISWHHTGNLQKLWKGVPNLKILEMETGSFDVGQMVAPSLERAIFVTGGLSKSCGKNIAKAKMPKIRHLEIYYGDDNYGGNCTIKEVKPLLDRSDLKHLEYLGLKNSQFANEIAKSIGGSKVIKKIKTLDLSCGTMTDEGAEALVRAKKSLQHLECLDLTSNFLSKDGIKAVQGLCKTVLSKSQNQPYDWGDDELHYYVSVAE